MTYKAGLFRFLEEKMSKPTVLSRPHQQNTWSSPTRCSHFLNVHH